MVKLSWARTLLIAVALMALSTLATAQPLPVSVNTSGNTANVVIGLPGQTLAEVSLVFADVSGLNASSLGVSAERVSLSDPFLLTRLPDLDLLQLSSALPLLITIEPPSQGGLSFRGTGRIEVHTHALVYSVGSSYRLLKAPLGGAFRDITDEVAQGSVRARGTYGGFSQFLIVADLRETGDVVDTKIAWLRNRIASLPNGERPAFSHLLDDVEAGVAQADYSAALTAIDAFRSRADSRGGQQLANEWRAARDVDNQAGELAAGAATLRFSVAYLRDFGQ
ncbi:MAG: DUF6689 family protein [Lysobacter sp.]